MEYLNFKNNNPAAHAVPLSPLSTYQSSMIDADAETMAKLKAEEQRRQEEYRKYRTLSETIRIAEQAMIHRDLSPSEAISLAKEFVEVANEFVNKE